METSNKTLAEEQLHTDTQHSADRPEYVAYPVAMKLLADRLDATPDEMAAWVFFGSGPGLGGLAAYLNANELDAPPRFYFSPGREGDFDYLSQLMGCWFIAEDIANFQPIEHYITGKALIDRWSKQPGIQPKAYILAKIRESRLEDFHPSYGGTEVSFPFAESFPPLEAGLFAHSHVQEIEASDFGGDIVEENVAGQTSHAAQTEAQPFHLGKARTNKKTWDDVRLRALWDESILPGVTGAGLAIKHGVSRQRIGALLAKAQDKFKVRNSWTNPTSTAKAKFVKGKY